MNPFQAKPSGIKVTQVSLASAEDHVLRIDPYPHQKYSIKLLAENLKKGIKKNILYLPTGSGKTAIASMIMSNGIKKRKRIAFTAPYAEVVSQSYTRLLEYGIPKQECSILMNTNPLYNEDALIQVCSVQTLVRRGAELLDTFDMIIVDEAHINFNKFNEKLQELDIPVIGLTATPFNTKLRHTYDGLVIPTTMRDLIDDDKLSNIRIITKGTPNLYGVSNSKGAFGKDYNLGELSKAMQSLGDDYIEDYKTSGADKHTLVFAVDVEHAKSVVERFNKESIPAEYILGDTPSTERKKILTQYERGITKVLVSVGVLTAGFDSLVDLIIHLRPTMSATLYLQQLGRGLRTAEGKEFLTVWDYSNNSKSFGYPQDVFVTRLPYEDDDVSTSTAYQCPECGTMARERFYKAPCRSCGYEEEDPEARRERERVQRQLRWDKRDRLNQADNERRRLHRSTTSSPYGTTVNSLLHSVPVIIQGKPEEIPLIISKDCYTVYYRDEFERKQHWFTMLLGYYEDAQDNGRDWKSGWVGAKYFEKFGEYPDVSGVLTEYRADAYTGEFKEFLYNSMVSFVEKKNTNKAQKAQTVVEEEYAKLGIV